LTRDTVTPNAVDTISEIIDTRSLRLIDGSNEITSRVISPNRGTRHQTPPYVHARLLDTSRTQYSRDLQLTMRVLLKSLLFH